MIYLVRVLIIILPILLSGCNSYDTEKNYLVAGELEKAGRYSEAIAILKKVQKNCDNSMKYNVELKLARNYYCLNDYKNSKMICNKLIESIPDSLDPRIKLGAQMVLLSIERETKGYENLLNFNE